MCVRVCILHFSRHSNTWKIRIDKIVYKIMYKLVQTKRRVFGLKYDKNFQRVGASENSHSMPLNQSVNQYNQKSI